MSNKNYAPIIETEGFGTIFKDVKKVEFPSYRVYLDSTINQSHVYAPLINLLATASDKAVIYLNLQSFGGDCHACVSVITAMRNSKAFLYCNVMGPCYSAGSTIALSGDHLEMQPHSMLMFHNFATSFNASKCNEIEVDIEESKKWIHGYMDDFHRPFLTKKECKSIKEGKDFYIHWDDPSMPQRLQRHFKRGPIELTQKIIL